MPEFPPKQSPSRSLEQEVEALRTRIRKAEEAHAKAQNETRDERTRARERIIALERKLGELTGQARAVERQAGIQRERLEQSERRQQATNTQFANRLRDVPPRNPWGAATEGHIHRRTLMVDDEEDPNTANVDGTGYLAEEGTPYWATGTDTLWANIDGWRNWVPIGGSNGGGPWLWDYLVNDEYAGTAGAEFTVFGHTYRVYSTIQAALTHAASLSASSDRTIGICGGDYAENLTISGPPTATITLVPAGRDRVTITGQTSGGTTVRCTGASTAVVIHDMTVSAHASAGARALANDGGSAHWELHNVIANSGTNAAGIAIDAGVPGVGWRLINCTISGSGIGFTDTSGGDSSDIANSVYMTNTIVLTPIGALLVNDGDYVIIGGYWSGAVGIRNSSNIFAAFEVYALNVRFANATAAMQCTGNAGFSRSHWIGCKFDECDKAFDFGATANASVYNRIEGCEFQAGSAGDKGIDDTSGQLRYSVIVGNTFEGYTAGDEIIGVDETDNEIAHNVTNAGSALPDSGTGHSSTATAAPSDADYLVGTANANLSAEIVVGTSPGGELGGTWASPTVDATHSGSAHTDFIAKAFVDAKGDLISASAADTPAILTVGANDTILMADSGQTTGLKWQAPATTSEIADIALAEAAGTSDTWARGDHVHAVKASLAISEIPFIIDGGGSAITTGIKGDLVIPYDCTINRATALADQSGSIVVDIWKDTYANYPPTDADSITASAPVTISTATKSQDSTLTGWTTSLSQGDTLRYNVDSITTVTRVLVSLKVTRT